MPHRPMPPPEKRRKQLSVSPTIIKTYNFSSLDEGEYEAEFEEEPIEEMEEEIEEPKPKSKKPKKSEKSKKKKKYEF